MPSYSLVLKGHLNSLSFLDVTGKYVAVLRVTIKILLKTNSLSSPFEAGSPN